jgi:transposase InsO family protein
VGYSNVVIIQHILESGQTYGYRVMKEALKKERIYRKEYGTIWDVKKDMFRYIELFYNRKRLHSVLKYMSPVAYRLKYDATKVA